MSTPLTLAWHYSKGVHLQYILKCGFLRPASIYVFPPEKPALWFSLNQYLEPTVIPVKIDFSTGIQTQLTLHEAVKTYGQFVRFGVNPRRLLPGMALRKKARIKSETWRNLARVAIDQGADPPAALWESVHLMNFAYALIQAMHHGHNDHAKRGQS